MHPFVPTPNGGKMSSHSTVTGQIWTKMCTTVHFLAPYCRIKSVKTRQAPKTTYRVNIWMHVKFPF